MLVSRVRGGTEEGEGTRPGRGAATSQGRELGLHPEDSGVGWGSYKQVRGHTQFCLQDPCCPQLSSGA